MRKISTTIHTVLSCLAIATMLWTLPSCAEKQEVKEQTVVKKERQSLMPILSKYFTDSLSSDTVGVLNGMRATYKLTDYAPIWLNAGNNYADVASFLTDLDSLAYDGISTSRYHIAELYNWLHLVRTNNSLSADSVAAFDSLLTYSYLLAAHDLQYGVVDPALADPEWLHDNDTLWEAPQILSKLKLDGKYTPLDNYRSKIDIYQLLFKQRKAYMDEVAERKAKVVTAQLLSGRLADSEVQLTEKGKGLQFSLHPDMLGSKDSLTQLIARNFDISLSNIQDSTLNALVYNTDSLLKKLSVNQERLRWLPQRFEDKYVLVNVPQMELVIKNQGKDTMHMRVVVGKRSRATPSMNADMVNIVFNPTWTVPKGIMKKDIVPGMQRKGSAYLDKKGLSIYTHQGKKVNPDSVTITYSNFKNYIFRQPPGYRNALGRIKFNLPNKENIYLHDTPSKSDFRKSYRAKSSGCVRVQHPQDMATYILNGWNRIDGRHMVDSLLGKKKMIFVPLKEKLPVHILYLTATEDSTRQDVLFLNDIYSKDDTLAQLLK